MAEITVVEGAFLFPVGGIIGRVKVHKHPPRDTFGFALREVKLAQHFGDSVAGAPGSRILKAADGRLARSSPLSGSEPQQSFSKGSSRRVFESFWFSYPHAIRKTRCFTIEASECRTLLFLYSGTRSETASHKPNSPSIFSSQRNPPWKADSRASAVSVSKRIVSCVAQEGSSFGRVFEPIAGRLPPFN